MYYNESTTAGFEPARSMNNSLAGNRVNHSAKSPNYILDISLNKFKDY